MEKNIGYPTVACRLVPFHWGQYIEEISIISSDLLPLLLGQNLSIISIIVVVKGKSSKWKDSIIYPNVSSVTKAAYNLKDSILGNFTKRKAKETNYYDENKTMEHESTGNLLQLFDKKGLNDLIRDQNLSKNEAKILGSKLEKRNLL